MKLSGGRTVPGWASAVSVVSFLFGVMFILMGLIGEYIGRILVEVRRRPRFLVNASIGVGGPSAGGDPALDNRRWTARPLTGEGRGDLPAPE